MADVSIQDVTTTPAVATDKIPVSHVIDPTTPAVITPDSINALHEAKLDPHAQYLQASDIGTIVQPAGSYESADSAIQTHITATGNPHGTTASDVGAVSSSVIDIAHADLLVLALADGLVPAQKYRITDFRTKHRIRGTFLPTEDGYYVAGYNDAQWNTDATGIPANMQPEAEPLTVTAISANALAIVATSDLYPQDIIHYELVDSTLGTSPLNNNDGDRGRIIYREDTTFNVICGFDFRNQTHYVAETVENSGVFNRTWYQDDPTTLFNRKLVKTFDFENFYGVSDGNNLSGVLAVRIEYNLNGACPCIWFSGAARDVSLRQGSENYIFDTPHAENITVGQCATIEINMPPDSMLFDLDVASGGQVTINGAGNVSGLTVHAGCGRFISSYDVSNVLVIRRDDYTVTGPLSDVVIGKSGIEYLLTEAQYIELDSQIGHVFYDELGVDTFEVGGVSALGNAMRNQTWMLTAEQQDTITLTDTFAVGARVRFVATWNDGSPPTINVPAGHIIYDAKTNATTSVTFVSDVGDTLDFQYTGGGIWRVQFFDFAAYVDGAIPWAKIDPTGSVVATGFSGNLDSSITTVQLLANAVDDLPINLNIDGGFPTTNYTAAQVIDAGGP